MGFGDDIMFTRQAKNQFLKTGKLVKPCGVCGELRWSPIFDNNPYMSIKGTCLQIHPRPYIQQWVPNRGIWKEREDNRPGELFIERLPKTNTIYIEPNIKGTVSANNKDWNFDKFQQVVDLTNYSFVQCGTTKSKKLKNVQFIETPSIMDAIKILSGCSLYVGLEGGMHHAAAALGLPAVVIFGGYINPKCTGYNFHRNLYVGSSDYPLGCGNLKSCAHCRECMDLITVEQVIGNINDTIRT